MAKPTDCDHASKYAEVFSTVGDAHPTVISFDMAPYKKEVQLIDARPDLKQINVPRPG